MNDSNRQQGTSVITNCEVIMDVFKNKYSHLRVAEYEKVSGERFRLLEKREIKPDGTTGRTKGLNAKDWDAIEPIRDQIYAALHGGARG